MPWASVSVPFITLTADGVDDTPMPMLLQPARPSAASVMAPAASARRAPDTERDNTGKAADWLILFSLGWRGAGIAPS